MNYFSCSLLRMVARILFAALFILSGLGKLMDPAGTIAYMASKNLPYETFLMYAAAAIEILGGICILLGFWTKTAATILFLFLIIVTVKMHNFWDLSGADAILNRIEFLKNLGILGGLLYIMSTGPGSWAICYDGACSSKAKRS